MPQATWQQVGLPCRRVSMLPSCLPTRKAPAGASWQPATCPNVGQPRRPHCMYLHACGLRADEGLGMRRVEMRAGTCQRAQAWVTSYR